MNNRSPSRFSLQPFLHLPFSLQPSALSLFFIFLSALSLQPSAFSQSPVLSWKVKIDDPKPRAKDWELRRGESVIFQPQFMYLDGSVHTLSNATAVYFRYTAGDLLTNTTYYVGTGSVYSATLGQARYEWTSANETTDDNLSYELAVVNSTQTMVRCFGRLNMKGGVGDSATAGAVTPVSSLDWAAVLEANTASAPYLPVGGSAWLYVVSRTSTWDTAASGNLTSTNATLLGGRTEAQISNSIYSAHAAALQSDSLMFMGQYLAIGRTNGNEVFSATADQAAINSGYNDGSRTNLGSGNINMGHLSPDSLEPVQAFLEFARGSINAGQIYNGGYQINDGAGSFNLGSIYDGGQLIYSNDIPDYAYGGNFNLGKVHDGSQTHYPTAGGCFNVGYVNGGTQMSADSGSATRGSFNLGHIYVGDQMVHSGNANLQLGYLYGGYQDIWASSACLNIGQLGPDGVSSATKRGYQAITNSHGCLNFGAVLADPVVAGVATQDILSASGCINAGYLNKGALSRISGSMGSIQSVYLPDSSYYAIMSGSGSASFGANITNAHDYSVVLGCGLNSVDTNAVHARKYYQAGTDIAAIFAPISMSLESVCANGSTATNMPDFQNSLRVSGGYLDLSSHGGSSSHAWPATPYGNLNAGFNNAGIRTNAGWANINLGDLQSGLQANDVAVRGCINAGSVNNGSQIHTGAALNFGNVNWGYVEDGTQISSLSRGSFNLGFIDGGIQTLMAAQGSLNFGALTSVASVQTNRGIGCILIGAQPATATPITQSCSNVRGSIGAGGDVTIAHNYAFVFGAGLSSVDTNAVHARKYYQAGTDIASVYAPIGFTTNFAVLVPGNLTNWICITNGSIQAISETAP